MLAKHEERERYIPSLWASHLSCYNVLEWAVHKDSRHAKSKTPNAFSMQGLASNPNEAADAGFPGNRVRPRVQMRLLSL